MSKNQTKASEDIITGIITGASDVLTTHPLWTIKTLTQDGLNLKQISSLAKKNPLILYNGVTANVVSMVPITATRVFLSANFSKALGNPSNEAMQLLSSGLAGGFSSLISAPTELARTVKLKSTVFAKDGVNLNHSYSNTNQIMKSVFKTHGIFDLFKGYSSIGARDGIYTAAFFSGGKIAKEYLKPYVENNIANSLIAYSSVSIFSSFINHPFDTIKTTQHIHFTSQWQLNHSHYDSSFTGACKKIYMDNGIKGFWAGYPSRCVRFLVGLVVKASILEKMEDFWLSNNEELKSVSLVGDSDENNDEIE